MHLIPVGDPIVVGENAHFLASDSATIRNVIVTPEALLAMTGDTAIGVAQMVELVDVFARVADENLSLSEPLDDRTWVLAADVKRWLANETLRCRRMSRPAA